MSAAPRGRCLGARFALAMFLLLVSVLQVASAETLGVITFDVPAGNRQAGPEVVEAVCKRSDAAGHQPLSPA
jgi:ABC-type thiamine transport system substrate-binding protein